VTSTTCGQQVVRATIADIAARLDETAPDGPVLIMIGRALAEVMGRGSASRGHARDRRAG
jgi:siroheme synthase